MNIDFEGIHACFVHGVAGAILSVSGDKAPRLRFVRIIHVIELLGLLPRVVGCVRIVALVITLAAFLFHIAFVKYKFNIDCNGD